MTPRYWLEISSKKKMALFAFAIVLIVAFWTILPAEIRAEMSRRYSRKTANLPYYMFVGWLGGWFMILFVRGEDLQVTAPANIQGFIRIIAGAMIAGALVIAGFLSIAFFL